MQSEHKTTDLPAKLRDTRAVYDGGCPTLNEAADEIERLRAALRGVVVLTAGLAWAREVHSLAKDALDA